MNVLRGSVFSDRRNEFFRRTKGAALRALLCLFLASCAAQGKFLSAPYQYAVYSGKAQPVDARVSRNAPPVISYFRSREDLSADYGGSAAAPSGAGLYYARIGQAGKTIAVVEYFIDRAWVTISAETAQEALYDGNPKRVAADAPVPLSVSYFPTRESRARAAVLETRPEQRGHMLKGYTRVESPPKEPGVYFVSVYYQGDSNYLPTVKEIKFTIRERARK